MIKVIFATLLLFFSVPTVSAKSQNIIEENSTWMNIINVNPYVERSNSELSFRSKLSYLGRKEIDIFDMKRELEGHSVLPIGHMYTINDNFGSVIKTNHRSGLTLTTNNPNRVIKNITDGIIIDKGYEKSLIGHYITVKHQTFIVTYGHLAHKSNLKIGSFVNQGDVLGVIGSSGTATSPMLYMESFVNGEVANPKLILDIITAQNKAINNKVRR